MSPPLTKPTTLFSTSPRPPSPLCTSLFLILLCILAFYTIHHPSSHLRNPHRFHPLFLSSSSNSTISSYLRALTLHPHLAGTPLSSVTTNYVHSHFQNLSLETHKIEYKPLISYPVRASLAAHFINGTVVNFSLTEKTVSAKDVVIPYHAYSPSGHAFAKVVFVNFGREEDYRALDALGVEVKGCVVLVKKGGGLSRVGAVNIAEVKGAVAVLIYAVRDRLRGGGVERGTVMRGVGDPLSPGWAGVEGGERLGLEDSQVVKRFPKIPSLPLSYENADVILGSLGGPVVPMEWRDSGRSRVLRVGPGPTMVNFTYQVGVW